MLHYDVFKQASDGARHGASARKAVKIPQPRQFTRRVRLFSNISAVPRRDLAQT